MPSGCGTTAEWNLDSALNKLKPQWTISVVCEVDSATEFQTAMDQWLFLLEPRQISTSATMNRQRMLERNSEPNYFYHDKANKKAVAIN